jgi:hypothetical protein
VSWCATYFSSFALVSCCLFHFAFVYCFSDCREDISLEEEEKLERRSQHGGRGAKPKKWDQFEAHERATGLKSTFNFDLYSTPLERDSAFYKQNIKIAEQESRAILSQQTNNLHVAEERHQTVSHQGNIARFLAVLDHLTHTRLFVCGCYIPNSYGLQMGSLRKNASVAYARRPRVRSVYACKMQAKV